MPLPLLATLFWSLILHQCQLLEMLHAFWQLAPCGNVARSPKGGNLVRRYSAALMISVNICGKITRAEIGMHIVLNCILMSMTICIFCKERALDKHYSFWLNPFGLFVQ